MKLVQAVLFSCLAFSMLAPAHARPLNAVGACPQGASMQSAGGIYQGNAQAMKNVADFAQRHAVATQQEDAWIHAMTGKSGINRLYREGAQQVVVVTLCNPTDCEHNRAYIAYEPKTGVYGGSIYEGSQVREFGPTPEDRMYPEPVASAIICAQNLDWGTR